MSQVASKIELNVASVTVQGKTENELSFAKRVAKSFSKLTFYTRDIVKNNRVVGHEKPGQAIQRVLKELDYPRHDILSIEERTFNAAY